MRHRTLSLLLATSLGTSVIAARTQADSRRVPLQPTTMSDWRAARMDGTGCYWSERKGGPVLFAAAGRTAVTRIAGRVVLLAPSPKAAELFPFTYDVWTSRGLEIRVVDGRVVRALGDETVTTDAVLIVRRRGKLLRLRGSMICGS